VITLATFTPIPNLVQILPWGASGQMCEMYLFMPSFYGNSPTGQTGRRIFTLDGLNNVESCKDLGDFVDIVANLWGKISQTHTFGA